MAILFTFYFFKYMILFTIIPFMWLCKGKCCTAKLYKMLCKQLFFDEILILLFEAYFEFIIAGYFNYKRPINTMMGEIMA